MLESITDSLAELWGLSWSDLGVLALLGVSVWGFWTLIDADWWGDNADAQSPQTSAKRRS